MRTYDLGFGESADSLCVTPEGDEFQLKDAVQAGWAGSNGPGIDLATWPRGPLTGLPMMHVLTVLLPEEYRCRGPEFPAIAFFQGEGQFANEDDPVRADPDSDDPFVRSLAATRPHPQLRPLSDLIGGAFALIWLTEAEYSAGPIAPPVDVRRDGEHSDEDEGPNAWDEVVPMTTLWLGIRDDPNGGRAPNTSGDNGYREPFNARTNRWHEWAEGLEYRCHLGGTTFCVQAMPQGLTPFYLELEEFGGLNFGGGTAQIDLVSDTFDWACG